MANKLKTMKNIRSVLVLHQKGFSGRQISKEMRLSRNTIKIYLDRFAASSLTLEQLLKLDDDAFGAIAYASYRQLAPEPKKEYFTSRISYFLSELNRTGVTRHLLWQEYKKEQPNGYSYSQFCDLLSENRKVQEASMHFEHHPAKVMMVDFAGDSLTYVDYFSPRFVETRTGGRRQ